MAKLAEMAVQAERKWAGQVQAWVDRRTPLCELRCPPSTVLPEVVRWVVVELG